MLAEELITTINQKNSESNNYNVGAHIELVVGNARNVFPAFLTFYFEFGEKAILTISGLDLLDEFLVSY